MKISVVVLCVFAVCLLFISPVYAYGELDTQDFTLSLLGEQEILSPKAAPIYGSVRDGERDSIQYPLPLGKTKLEISLSWSNPQNVLSMTITRPDGYSYPTFDDSYDGSVDGRISLGITGNIQGGDWIILIYGEDVSGIQSYVLQYNAA